MSTLARLPWELLGAVIGAGLASGREVASFFTRFGPWSWPGIVLAATVLWLLANAEHRPQGRLWRTLQTLLLIATGGAMLAGAGEVAALTLPIHGAYLIGLGGTLALAWRLARRTIGGLTWVSRGLLAVLAILVALGLTRPPMQAVPLTVPSVPVALLSGVAYGGFNAALQAPILAQYDALPSAARRRGATLTALILLMLLCLCNAVLMRHPALIGEAMPFVRLTAQLGPVGYALGAVTLYLAILSTLTACVKGLGGGAWPMVGLLIASAAGFTGVVEVLYPMLGGGCLLLMLHAKFRDFS